MLIQTILHTYRLVFVLELVHLHYKHKQLVVSHGNELTWPFVHRSSSRSNLRGMVGLPRSHLNKKNTHNEYFLIAS